MERSGIMWIASGRINLEYLLGCYKNGGDFHRFFLPGNFLFLPIDIAIREDC